MELKIKNRTRWIWSKVPILVMILLFLISLNGFAEEAVKEQKKKSQEERIEELEKKLQSVTEEVQKLKSQGVAEQKVKEIEEKLDVLAEEIEKIKSAAVEKEPEYKEVFGQAPAASKVFLVGKGLSIGGYGELAGEFRRKGDNIADLERAVLYFGYKFTDRIIFNSEIEFEHAGITEEGKELAGDSGEVDVEFANLSFLLHDRFNIRAGLILIPIGIINEVHEPTTFFGVLRPDVETFIIPTTWRENGIGIFGQLVPGLSYRAYVVAGLNSRGFSAEEGIAGGRSNGTLSRINDPAFVGRVEYNRILGLRVGGSFYIGNSGQNEEVNGKTIGGLTTIYEADVEYQYRGFEARGLFAFVNIHDAALINLNNGFEGMDSIGKDLYGWYVEAGYNVLPLFFNTSHYLAPFARFEAYNTQFRVPSGFESNPANNRKTITFGLSYKPIPNVVIKLDFQDRRNENNTAENQFNVGLGYVF